MTSRPLLSIGDFATATMLYAQTLRYYHSEGLLIPTEVDEETGYRSYTFNQVHRALLVVALRRAGVGIRDIRALLEAPNLLPAVLIEHQTVLDRQRSQQDTAMTQARQLAEGWPTVDDRDRPPITAVTRRVPGEAVGPHGEVIPQRVRVAADSFRRELVETGAEISGSAWCQYALDTPEDRAKAQSHNGPDWTIAVELRDPEDAAHRLPSDAHLLVFSGHRERVVRLLEVPTVITFAAAIEHLTQNSLDLGLVPDLGRSRYIFETDYVELAVTIVPDWHGHTPPGTRTADAVRTPIVDRLPLNGLITGKRVTRTQASRDVAGNRGDLAATDQSSHDIQIVC